MTAATVVTTAAAVVSIVCSFVEPSADTCCPFDLHLLTLRPRMID